jgi:hypothetical protein
MARCGQRTALLQILQLSQTRHFVAARLLLLPLLVWQLLFSGPSTPAVLAAKLQ